MLTNPLVSVKTPFPHQSLIKKPAQPGPRRSDRDDRVSQYCAVISSPPLSSRCLKHWWMDHFRRRSRKVYRSKHQRDQQCSNCHDDTETGTNTCRLSLDYLNTPANLIYLVL